MEQARVGIRAYRGGFILIAAFLLVALILPVCAVLWQSFLGKNGEVGLQNWAKVLSDPEFFALLGRSFLVAVFIIRFLLHKKYLELVKLNLKNLVNIVIYLLILKLLMKM